MDNKSEIIKLLFCKVPAEKILSALNTTTVLASKSREFNYNNIPLDETEKYMRAYMPHFSGDEIQHAVKTVRGKSEVELPLSHAADGLNIFALVLYFANSVLIMRNGRITCRYEKLFKWHLLSHDVDEDTFTTAFAAYHDIEFDYLRKYFGWSNIIKSDNVRLKNVLNQGIAENHFHLKGSAPCFQLNWIYLMNKALNTTIVHKNRIRKELDKWDKEPLSPSLHIDTSKKSDFYTLILKAAIIRFFLFCEMNKGLGLFLPCISVDWKDVSRYLELEEFKNVTINVKICNAYVGYKNAGSFDADILRIDLIYRKDFLDGLETIAPPLGKALIELITQLFCGCDIQRFPDSNPKIYIKDFFNILRNESCSLRLNILKNLVTPQTYLYLSETYQKAFVVELLDNDNSEDPTFLTYIEEIDSFIVGIRDTISDMDKLVDYALLEKDGGSKSSENIWFHGERKLMYDVYKSLFSKKLSDPILGNLFFAYLQIKLKFRAELIQLNSHIGFYNFARYQDRKEAFIDWDKHYSRAVIDIAISESTKEQSIVSIEARITPLETSIKIHKRIKEYDKIISGAPKGNDAHDKRVFYMFSFPKEKEKDRSNEDYLAIPYRHADYRDKLDKLAKAIVGFRKEHPDTASRVFGIDACASEFHCRAEVFGPIFRYLSSHTIYEEDTGDVYLPALKKTYHVGEDFFDLIDGLRAIEEAVLFLNLGEGDRLGHALALGIEVEPWYRKKKMRVQLDQHTLIDNLAWIYAKIREYGLSEFFSLSEEIDKEFLINFSEVYELPNGQNRSGNFENVELVPNIKLFYEAWKLRGDHPQPYRAFLADGKVQEEVITNHREKFYINKFDLLNPIMRDKRVVSELYYRYHYDAGVRKRGEKSVEYEITLDYVRCAAAIQGKMQKMISSRHIGIECNPSSNYLIGSLKKYIEHPIFKWYNVGLTNDTTDCRQLFVSINTDDQGIFNTNLENEYALMSRALEKYVDKNGEPIYSQAQIYDWLDRVRRMGLEQTFNPHIKSNRI